MHITDRLSRPQQVIVVIALGLALGAAGSCLMSLGGGIQSGWFAYAPLTATLAAPGTGLPGWLRLIIWLILIGVWTLASIRVLRTSPDPGAPRLVIDASLIGRAPMVPAGRPSRSSGMVQHRTGVCLNRMLVLRCQHAMGRAHSG